MNKKKMICVVGRTCSGKDTLVHKLTDQFPEDFKPFISYTDRPMREGETNGVEHKFISKDEFDTLYFGEPSLIPLKEGGYVSRVLAYTKIASEQNPDGYRYMTLYEQLEDSNLYIIDPDGLEDLMFNFPQIEFHVIYINASENTREERAKKRSDYATKYKKRCEQEDEQFSFFEASIVKMQTDYEKYQNNSECYYYTVENDGDLEKSYIKFAYIALKALEFEVDKNEI